MKKKIKSSLVLIFVLFVFSCKKTDTTSQSITTSSNGIMTAKFNDSDWVSIQNYGIPLIDTAKNLIGLVLEGQTSSDFLYLQFNVQKSIPFVPIGKHVFGDTLNYVSLSYQQQLSTGLTAQYIVDSGTLVITSVDNINKRISGIFNFTLSSSVAGSLKITNGIFRNIRYYF